MIDRKQAAEALDDIDAVVRRVRQSRIYNLASLMLIMWGVLVFAGYVLNFLSPRNGAVIWIAKSHSTPEPPTAPRSLTPPRDGSVFYPTSAQWASLTVEPAQQRVFRSEHVTEGKIAID